MAVTEKSLISMLDNCPWGMAVFNYENGKVLASNHCMRSVYGCCESISIYELFSISPKKSLSVKLGALQPGEKWSSRIYPRGNQYGISSVEVMFERLVETPEQVWLYALEHPMVNNEVRFSSRSELEMLRVLLDNTLEYVFFRDPIGRFILANEAFRSTVAMEGRTPGMETKIEDFVSPGSAAWMKSLDTRVFETGKPVVNEVSLFVFQNGTKHWLQLTTVPVSNGEGAIIGSLSVARDISDLKYTESELRSAIAEAQEASRAKGDFLATMSHEIRTPLNGIIGASELCQETSLDVEQRGYLDTVIHCGSTLLNLVNDVLDFSKIEAGQLNLESLNFSSRNLMESVADEFSQAARAKGVELVVSYGADLPEYILGDPTRVKQIFYNLIGNALKFTDSGEIVIRAEVADLNVDSVRILFSVTDSGIGISEDRQKAIFQSFTQADMSTTRKYGGSGLGLSICKELVRLMGGTLDVTSKLGEGARFEFEIPFQFTANSGSEAVPFNAELAGLRVLIIDDEPANRELYQQRCTEFGFRVGLAEGGEVGLSALESALSKGDPYRLILLDQQMPGLSGLEFASLIRSRFDLRDTNIILLSSSLNRQELERAQVIGIAHALSKPVKRATLLEVILETFGIDGGGDLAKSNQAHSLPKKCDPMHVLLVEDNPINQNLASRRLEKLGHQVSLAKNGHEAVEMAGEEHFDCILMDIQMPDMDGFEATRQIRSHEKKYKRPHQYIIAMTAHAMKEDRQRCLKAGMDDYIPKPFRAEIFREKLELAAGARVGKPEPVSAKDGGAFAQYLQSMSEEDREDILATVPIFLKTVPSDLLKLEDAVSKHDFEACYGIAHTMKGVTGIFGSEVCMTLAEEMEAVCKTENPQALETIAESFIEAVRTLAREAELATP